MDQTDSVADNEFSSSYPDTPVCILRFCRKTARQQRWAFYDDLNKSCGLGFDFTNRSDGEKIGTMLGNVSEFECLRQRPMLSAVIVLKASRRPGSGFYDWAETLGIPRVPGEDDQKFHMRILIDVLAYWAKHP